MDESVHSIAWEAYPHHHIERGSDWYWLLGIITISGTVAAIILGNPLFGLLVFIAGVVSGLQSIREPRMVPFAITTRGVQMNDTFYPYATLESFFIDEENRHGPQLFLKSKKMFVPLLIFPLPEENVDDVEEIVASRIPEEHLEEPFAHVLLEFLGY